MFKHSFAKSGRVNKTKKTSKRSFNDDAKQRLRDKLNAKSPEMSPSIGSLASPQMPDGHVLVVVGDDLRQFCAKEEVLFRSPWFVKAGRAKNFHYFQSVDERRIDIPDMEPQVFAAVLEYLYCGEYTPHLAHHRESNTWSLTSLVNPSTATISSRASSRMSTKPDAASIKSDSPREVAAVPTTIYVSSVDGPILRDVLVYCAAFRFELPELQRLALRKLGLCSESNTTCKLIIDSARFAYANTPDTDSRIRPFFVRLISDHRKSFKNSGSMMEDMAIGDTRLYFDLFATMCAHIEGLEGKCVSLKRQALSAPIPEEGSPRFYRQSNANSSKIGSPASPGFYKQSSANSSKIGSRTSQQYDATLLSPRGLRIYRTSDASSSKYDSMSSTLVNTITPLSTPRASVQ